MDHLKMEEVVVSAWEIYGLEVGCRGGGGGGGTRLVYSHTETHSHTSNTYSIPQPGHWCTHLCGVHTMSCVVPK